MSIGELKGMQEMYHDLGETSYLVRGLVFGVRPSIAWRFGVPLSPLDNLTADGQLGWQVGLKTIMRRHQRESDEIPASVMTWLQIEAAKNQRSQVPTLEVIESLRWCLPSLNDEILAMDTNDFVRCWTENLIQSAEPRRSGTELLMVRSLARDTIRQLNKFPGTDSLVTALSSFGQPDTAMLERESGQAWQRLASPRLHPPIRDRQDWLDVLAEVHVTSEHRAISESQLA